MSFLSYFVAIFWFKAAATHILPLGYQSKALPVSEIQGFVSPDDFFSDYVIPGQPVIFRGAGRDFPAHNNWSDEYFLSQSER